MEKHNFYMSQALDLARLGWGRTNPNPLVGAVIVKNQRIIGEGYHKVLGGPHAEIEALNSLSEDSCGSTVYVNLEPCSHFGRTPPCADALIKARVGKVVIGMTDPNPLVSGTGILLLKKAGIKILKGVMEKESQKLNEIFIKYITKKKPFVMIKSAMTLDGKIATRTGDSKWITNEESRLFVHNLRNRFSAIMVGINTILQDDPALTTRLPDNKGRDPVRIVIDSDARIPLNAKVITSSLNSPMILAVSGVLSKEKLKQLKDKNVKIVNAAGKDGNVDLGKLTEELYNMQIDSVLIEGGGTLNYSALKAGIVDKVLMFVAPKIVGGVQAKTAFEGEGVSSINEAYSIRDCEIKKFGHDILIEGYL